MSAPVTYTFELLPDGTAVRFFQGEAVPASRQAAEAMIRAGRANELIRYEEEEPYEGGFCSIRDGLGHGYPGAGPCPLEMRGWEDAEEDRRREAGYAYA